MSRLASIIGVTAILATPASAGWRDQAIDGSGARAFERSVAVLQSDLPRRRREDFEMALAFIWIGNTVDIGDNGLNSDADLDEARRLKEFTEGLLTEIKRGDVLAAVEKREEAGSGYTAADYVEQLDGLQFQDVVSLGEQYGSAPDLREVKLEIWCRKPQRFIGTSRATNTWCDDPAVACPTGDCISRTAGMAFNAATGALEEEDYDDARSAIERLNFDRLTPFEHSKAEQILARIAYAEQDYVETREHMRNAIYAGGLSAEQEREFRNRIDLLDAQLSASAPAE